MASAEPATIAVEVVCGLGPREVERVLLDLPAGATVADAVRASGLAARHGWPVDDTLSVGVWTKPRPLDAPLREADRVEIYQPLRVDPKEARRQRYRKERRDSLRGKPAPPKAG